MKCETAQQVFSDYFEETIERPLALTLERHLGQCEDCRQAYGDFRSTWRLLETFPTIGPPSGFRQSVLSRIQTQQEVAVQKPAGWRLSLGNVFGARVPARSFAWALSMLIFAVLLVRVSPGVFQSTLTGPIGSAWVQPMGPGMEVGVRVVDDGGGADVYQIALKPMRGTVDVEARLCWLKNGREFCKAEIMDGRETVVPIVVWQPQTEPRGITVKWGYSGREYAKLIFLPRSQTASENLYSEPLRGTVDNVLREIAVRYGVVVSADAGLEGTVELSGNYGTAREALGRIADQTGTVVRKESSRSYALEPK